MSGGTRRMWLVARREWNQRVRSLAFRISTLISILIVVALIVVPEMYGGGVKPTRTVGLVGQSSSQLPALLRAVRRPARSLREDPRVRRRGRRPGRAALGRRVGAAGGSAGARLEGGGR